MKVLIEVDNSPIVIGVSAVLEATGHDVEHWSPTGKPAFDVFDEFEPDIFLSSGSYGRPVMKCVNERSTRLRHTNLLTVPHAADTITFGQGKRRDALFCDVVCVADVDDNIFDALVRPLLDLNIKIVGHKRWDVPEYLGPVTNTTLADLYASATVSLVLEPNRPIYDILASGGFPVSLRPYPESFSERSLCFTETLVGFEDTVRRMVGVHTSKERKAYVEAGKKVISDGETYWHRVADLFRTHWGMNEEANRVMNTYYESIKF